MRSCPSRGISDIKPANFALPHPTGSRKGDREDRRAEVRTKDNMGDKDVKTWNTMTGPWNSPSPELAEAAHPELENVRYPEKVVILENRKVARRLHRGLLIAVVAILAAVALLVLLLYAT